MYRSRHHIVVAGRAHNDCYFHITLYYLTSVRQIYVFSRRILRLTRVNPSLILQSCKDIKSHLHTDGNRIKLVVCRNRGIASAWLDYPILLPVIHIRSNQILKTGSLIIIPFLSLSINSLFVRLLIRRLMFDFEPRPNSSETDCFPKPPVIPEHTALRKFI